MHVDENIEMLHLTLIDDVYVYLWHVSLGCFYSFNAHKHNCDYRNNILDNTCTCCYYSVHIGLIDSVNV